MLARSWQQIGGIAPRPDFLARQHAGKPLVDLAPFLLLSVGIAAPMRPEPRAWRWQRMLDEGIHTSDSEIGDAENISKSYVSRILRLALLTPD